MNSFQSFSLRVEKEFGINRIELKRDTKIGNERKNRGPKLGVTIFVSLDWR